MQSVYVLLLAILASVCHAWKITIEGAVFCPNSVPLAGIDIYLTQSRIGINNNKIVSKSTTDEEGRFSMAGDGCQSRKFALFAGFRCDSINATRVISQCPTWFKAHPDGLAIGDRFCETYKNGPQWAYLKMELSEFYDQNEDGDFVTSADLVLNPSNLRVGRRFFSIQ